MNKWLKLSIDYANNNSYLDDLLQVYPIIMGSPRTLDLKIWGDIENAFNTQNNIFLIESLLKLELFPVKDSYVGSLRIDSNNITKNPKTIKRICTNLYTMGLTKIKEECIKPKETNRQMAPHFKTWARKSLGFPLNKLNIFQQTTANAILDAGDKVLSTFAKSLGYNNGDKGLDIVVRSNNTYVFGEAKFITTEGGNQDKSFAEIIGILSSFKNTKNTQCIAIIDGISWFKDSAHYKLLTTNYKDYNIMSALVLKEFLSKI
jgi:hypothetical protein